MSIFGNPWDNPSNYKRTRKKKYTITASMPPEGTVVFNHLENTVYKTSKEKQFVLTGTVGEQWVVDVNTLCSDYTLEDGTAITKEVLQRKVVPGYKDCVKYPCIKPFNITTIPGDTIWAIHVPVRYKFQIPTSLGDVLTVNGPHQSHGLGDYIVCKDVGGYPDLNNRWVVDGEIFPNTYDMRAFPNIGTYTNNGGVLKEHREFMGVSWVPIAGERHSGRPMTEAEMDHSSIPRKQAYDIFKKLASEVCLNVHKEYPGHFGKPRTSLDKKKVIIPFNDGKPLLKSRIEIIFNYDDGDGDLQQIDIDAIVGNTNYNIGFTFHNCNIDYVMEEVRGLLMDTWKI